MLNRLPALYLSKISIGILQIQKIQRIDTISVYYHLKMKMWSCGIACGSYERYLFSFTHMLPLRYK